MTTIAVVVRTQDGVFQPMLFGASRNTTIFQLTGCVLRKVVRHGTAPCISTLSDLPADVFVFVNVPLETTNHMLLEALVKQAMRPDCGIASGIQTEHFFAVRRDRLLAVGGLSVVSSGRMPELLRRLTNAAHEANLHLLVTPDAVATLSGSFIQR